VLFVPWLTLQLIDVFLVPFLSALDILERIVVTNRLNGFVQGYLLFKRKGIITLRNRDFVMFILTQLRDS
jgi:hypothetical protein